MGAKMKPQKSGCGSLVDLLDRILERGVVIKADLVITIAGIPLIGLNLNAALAGMETMIKYGFLTELDMETRESWCSELILQTPEILFNPDRDIVSTGK